MSTAVFMHREVQIRQWFSMWLDKQDTGIGDLFAPDAVYIESWGPEYHGSGKIKLWFDEWNTRGNRTALGHPTVFPQGESDCGGVVLPVCHDGWCDPEL